MGMASTSTVETLKIRKSVNVILYKDFALPDWDLDAACPNRYLNLGDPDAGMDRAWPRGGCGRANCAGCPCEELYKQTYMLKMAKICLFVIKVPVKAVPDSCSAYSP